MDETMNEETQKIQSQIKELLHASELLDNTAKCVALAVPMIEIFMEENVTQTEFESTMSLLYTTVISLMFKR